MILDIFLFYPKRKNMNSQYHRKDPYTNDLIPLLDREFDEKQTVSHFDYDALYEHQSDGNSYIMHFNENTQNTDHRRTIVSLGKYNPVFDDLKSRRQV